MKNKQKMFKLFKLICILSPLQKDFHKITKTLRESHKQSSLKTISTQG